MGVQMGIGLFTKVGNSVMLKMYVPDEICFVFHTIWAQAMTLTYNPSHSQD